MKDEIMQEAFYDIEYGKFTYTADFHDSDEERKIDKLLRHFSNIAILWENGLLNLTDIGPLKYFIKRTVEHTEIIKYFDFLDDWVKTSKTGADPFLSLNKLCKEL